MMDKLTVDTVGDNEGRSVGDILNEGLKLGIPGINESTMSEGGSGFFGGFGALDGENDGKEDVGGGEDGSGVFLR